MKRFNVVQTTSSFNLAKWNHISNLMPWVQSCKDHALVSLLVLFLFDHFHLRWKLAHNCYCLLTSLFLLLNFGWKSVLPTGDLHSQELSGHSLALHLTSAAVTLRALRGSYSPGPLCDTLKFSSQKSVARGSRHWGEVGGKGEDTFLAFGALNMAHTIVCFFFFKPACLWLFCLLAIAAFLVSVSLYCCVICTLLF